MKKELISLIAIAIIILIVLGSFIIYNEWPKITGKKIILNTMPVDPFDPFRGQYMRINYEISDIEASGFSEGDKIYVLLKENNEGIWEFEDYSKVKPLEGYFIKGEVEYSRGDSVRIEYGIEQFFFEKNADVPTTNITVEVFVANSGRATFGQLLQNGAPIEIEYKEY